MGHEHWFDIFSMALVRAASRRGLLGGASLLGAGLLYGDTVVVKAAGSKNKNKMKQKAKKHRPKPPPPPVCSGGAGAAEPEWAGRPGQIGHCEFVCRQCNEHDTRQFCIVDGTKADGTPTKVARCCPEGHTCCGGQCCETDDPYTACCDGKCVNTENHPAHCGSCGNQCPTGEVCNLGQCVCSGACDDFCPVGLTLCGDECVNTANNPRHCGGCFNSNPNGLKCCGGNPCTYVNGVCCEGTCYPQGWPSC